MSKRTRELAAARRDAEKPLALRRKIVIGAGSAALLGLLVFGFRAAVTAAPSPDAAVGWDPAARLFETDVVFGRPDAPVTVVEYASLTCVHCARFHNESLPGFIEGWVDSGKARLVFRSFPFDAAALSGAALVSCLPPEVREAAVSALMRRQERWIGSDDTARAALDLLALERRTATLAKQCLAAGSMQGKLMVSVTEARSGGVSVTPTFVIGRKAYTGFMSADALGALVDGAAARPEDRTRH